MMEEEEEEVSFLPETQIQQYIRDIETNETQLLGATLKEIYEKNVSKISLYEYYSDITLHYYK